MRALSLAAAALVLVAACSPASTPRPTAAPTQAAAAGANPTASATLTPVTIATTAVTGAFGGLWTAAEAGYFRDEGVDVQFVSVTDTARAIPTLISNEAQFGTIDGQVLVQADVSGANVKTVAAITNRLVFSVMALPDIAGPTDLKGKTMGISGAGSSTDTAARQALRIWGLQPGTDVALVPMNGVPNILTGLQAQQIQAGVVSPPTNTRARQAGMKELLNLATDGPEWPAVTLSTTQSFIDKDPKTVLAVVRGFSRGLHRFVTDEAFATQVLSKYLQLQDQAVLNDTWEQFKGQFSGVPYPTNKGFSSVIDAVAESQPAARETKPENYVDSSFVKQLDDTGFYKQLGV